MGSRRRKLKTPLLHWDPEPFRDSNGGKFLRNRLERATMKLLWDADFPIAFFGGFAVVYALYATMCYGRSQNFFRWRCVWRMGALEVAHLTLWSGAYHAVFSDHDNWQYLPLIVLVTTIISTLVHWVILTIAHDQARNVVRRRLVHKRALL